MKIPLKINKTVEENASLFFEKAKKCKKKLKGAKKALSISLKKLSKLEKDRDARIALEEEKLAKQKEKRVKKWYEKFKWFFTSEGFLCISGSDATTNEIIIKKHMQKDDVVMHTDMAGSPFTLIKKEILYGKEDKINTTKKIGKASIDEAAHFTAAYSRAWKMGLGTLEVFDAKPEQITKKAQSGEFLPKGAFMVRGKVRYHKPAISICLGLREDEVIISGAENSVKKYCKKYVTLIQGREKTTALAKQIQKKLGGGDLDEIVKFIPTGGGKIK